MLNWNTVWTMPIAELRQELRDNFSVTIPEKIETLDDMRGTQSYLSLYAANYAFLSAMAVEVKGMKRKAKRGKEKDVYEHLLEKEELLTTYSENMKLAYTACSRMLSVAFEIHSSELKLLDGNRTWPSGKPSRRG